MCSEGDVILARENFLSKRFNNVNYLLMKRYDWMNAYLSPKLKIVELGVGAGFSELYLDYKPLMTDTIKQDWVDEIVDATQMSFASNSVDIIIASHVIHHFSSPYKFFKECQRVLKIGGLVLVQEINTSLMMRIMLWAMRHEGWSYDIDVFDKNVIANDPTDPWSANCAIPEILFEQPQRFEETFDGLKLLRNVKVEGFIFPVSGGVIAKVRVPELPTWLLNIISAFDSILIKLFPSIFAVGRQIVIKKYK